MLKTESTAEKDLPEEFEAKQAAKKSLFAGPDERSCDLIDLAFGLIDKQIEESGCSEGKRLLNERNPLTAAVLESCILWKLGYWEKIERKTVS